MADTSTQNRRGGNDAPGKAWNPATRDPPLSTALGNPAHDAGFPHSHRAGDGLLSSTEGKTKPEAKTAFPWTDAGHFRHHNGASVAALRSRPASHRNQ